MLNGKGEINYIGSAIGSGIGITSMNYVYGIGDLDIIGDLSAVNTSSVANSEIKTIQELKGDEILSKLGSGFKKDTGINNGYPILSWQQ